jgi:hypothetical protein
MQAFIKTAFGRDMAVEVTDTFAQDGTEYSRIRFADGGWADVKTSSLTNTVAAAAAYRRQERTEQATTVDLSTLPEGSIYVAVGSPLQFFKIDHVADGKWAGWVFVKRQAGDNFDRFGSQRPGATYRGAAADLLAQVAAEPFAAMARYGVEIGRCGNCNRTLTDETSRARGIGPDCWQVVGAAATALYEQQRLAMKAEYAEQEREQETAAFMADAATWR